jgi:hypothetical protein
MKKRSDDFSEKQKKSIEEIVERMVEPIVERVLERNIERIVTPIIENKIENAINGLAIILNNSFIAIHKEINDLREEFSRKFDTLTNRLDDIIQTKADRSELKLLDGRVVALEKTSQKSRPE